jgi:hypothetical protein
MVNTGALVVPWTGPHPGGEAFGRRKRRRGGANFRDDLLRQIDTETRDRRESLHGVLMHAKQAGDLRIELVHVAPNHLQFSEGVVSHS